MFDSLLYRTHPEFKSNPILIILVSLMFVTLLSSRCFVDRRTASKSIYPDRFAFPNDSGIFMPNLILLLLNCDYLENCICLFVVRRSGMRAADGSRSLGEQTRAGADFNAEFIRDVRFESLSRSEGGERFFSALSALESIRFFRFAGY